MIENFSQKFESQNDDQCKSVQYKFSESKIRS